MCDDGVCFGYLVVIFVVEVDVVIVYCVWM